MNKKEIARILRELGADQRNAHRIANNASGVASVILVSLLSDLIDRGIKVKNSKGDWV